MKRKWLEFGQHPYWIEMLSALNATRPTRLAYDPVKDNYREVCASELIQRGFDLALSIIKEPTNG